MPAATIFIHVLTLFVILDLALSLTRNINNSEFTILLILVILASTIFFCHGLIKLCLFVMRPQTAEEQEHARLPNMFGPGGYAIPRRPIRVVLARDEEAAGLESETNKLQPPAYGLWRESVVCISFSMSRPAENYCPLLTVIPPSALIPIAYTGLATSSRHRLQAAVDAKPEEKRAARETQPDPRPLGRLRTHPKTASPMWWRHGRVRWRR